VVTMYSKNGGKAGAHSWVPTCDSIGSLSYTVVQLYQHSFRRQFKFTHRNYVILRTLRFAHLPANSFLVLLPPNDEGIKHFQGHLEIGPHAQKVFEELRMETDALGKAVASLNTVRRKGKAHANIIDIEEDEEMVE
ncbi:hypothetical protein B0H13DRAFT_1588330, partial [Mycena leptocephala]